MLPPEVLDFDFSDDGNYDDFDPFKTDLFNEDNIQNELAHIYFKPEDLQEIAEDGEFQSCPLNLQVYSHEDYEEEEQKPFQRQNCDEKIIQSARKPDPPLKLREATVKQPEDPQLADVWGRALKINEEQPNIHFPKENIKKETNFFQKNWDYRAKSPLRVVKSVAPGSKLQGVVKEGKKKRCARLKHSMQVKLLSGLAFVNSPKDYCSLKEIYAFICENFEGYTLTDDSWKSAIRHSLCEEKMYGKADGDGNWKLTSWEMFYEKLQAYTAVNSNISFYGLRDETHWQEIVSGKRGIPVLKAPEKTTVTRKHKMAEGGGKRQKRCNREEKLQSEASDTPWTSNFAPIQQEILGNHSQTYIYPGRQLPDVTVASGLQYPHQELQYPQNYVINQNPTFESHFYQNQRQPQHFQPFQGQNYAPQAISAGFNAGGAW